MTPSFLDPIEYAAFERLVAEHIWRAEKTRSRPRMILPPLPISENKPRSNPFIITAFGKTQSFAEWARETGIARSTIRNRLLRGWSIEVALGTTTKNGRPKK